jgi:hypothetical protein
MLVFAALSAVAIAVSVRAVIRGSSRRADGQGHPRPHGATAALPVAAECVC